MAEGLFEVYKYLWGDDFVNIFGPRHLDALVENLKRYKNDYIPLINHTFTSAVGTNAFINLPGDRRISLVNEFWSSMSDVPEAVEVLTS